MKNQSKTSNSKYTNEYVRKLLKEARPFGVWIDLSYQELEKTMNAPFGEVFKRELCRKLELEIDKRIVEAYRG